MSLKKFIGGERLLASDLNSMVDQIETNISMVETTWSNLKTLRDSSKLTPGATYRITDYTCTTVQEDTRSAGHVFDILVTADDVNKLNENAHAIQHSGDTYFSNSDLSAWELKYCLDNDTTRFSWADSSSAGRGVVYYMKDDLNNECPYDFKNIQFKLVKLESITWNDNVSEYLQSSYNKQFVGHYVGEWFTVNQAGTANTNTGDTKYFYTFSLCNNNVGNDDDEIVDGSLRNSNTKDSANIYRSNIIPEYIPTDGNNSQKLNFMIFKPFYGNDDDCCCNVFGKNCYNNVLDYAWAVNNIFGNNCYNNTFGYACYRNIFGNECYNNTFGNYYESNTFGNNCYSNTFGDNCGYNKFGNSCYSNTFGKYCFSNTLENDCYRNILVNQCFNNTFGNSFQNNTFGNGCDNNTFGNSCNNNTFGKDCCGNTFGNGCDSNTFGNSCKDNTFGNNCYNNTFGNDFIYHCTFFDGVKYLNVSITTASKNFLQNMQVLNGVQGTSSSKLQITGDTYVTAGRAYTTTIGKNSSGTLTSKAPMD